MVPSQWGGGRFFGASTVFFFTKMAVTRERKVEKLLPRWEMNGLSEATNGPLIKIGIVWQISDIWANNRDFGLKKSAHF